MAELAAVGTRRGLYWLGTGERRDFVGSEVAALSREGREAWWAVTDGNVIHRATAPGEWQAVATIDAAPARCLLAAGGRVWIGTQEGHLLSLAGGRLEPVPSFDDVEGRQNWYTPWGGPPDARSISSAPDGVLYVNVHVGGVLRSRDGGHFWQPTIDLHSDVHQVLAHPHEPEVVLVAAAVGLAVSLNAGTSWQIQTEGLHATYLRSVAVAGEHVVVSASTGPGGRRSGLYRRRLHAGPFQRCREGLPEWFSDNIDTGCLDASGGTVAFGTEDGSVYVSADGAESWELIRSGLPPVTALALA